jgi:hypothetical protein
VLFLSLRRVVVVVLVVAIVVVAANPTWATAIGIDVWNLPSLQEELVAGTAKGREIQKEDNDIMRRMELKDRLVGELIEGRTTLAEVTSQFLALNQHREAYMSVIRANCAGRTDEERTARNVLHYVAQRLPALPSSSQDEATARLETEFANLVARTAEAE